MSHFDQGSGVYTGTLRTPMALSVATASAIAIFFASGLERDGRSPTELRYRFRPSGSASGRLDPDRVFPQCIEARVDDVEQTYLRSA